jgi:hypothetical protein
MVVGCASPQQAAPAVQAAERARLARLPSDERGMDARWRVLELRSSAEAGLVVAAIELEDAKVRIFNRGGAPGGRFQLRTELLRDLPAVDVDRISVRGSELVYVDATEAARPELWLHDIELSVENLATRLQLADRLPILLTARGRVQRSGTLTAWVSADPFGEGLDVAGRVTLEGLRVSELYEFLQVATGLQARGTIDLYVEFVIARGRVRAGVKPILRDVDVEPARDDLMHGLTALAVDLGADVLSNRIVAPPSVAAVVPIAGTISDPSVDVWAAVESVLRHAFVEGVAAGFAHVPPPPGRARP